MTTTRPTQDRQPHLAASQEDEQSGLDAVRSWLESGAWTEELYFALPEMNHLLELSDGKLIVPDMPTLGHQRIVRRFLASLERWNEHAQAGEPVFAPYPIRLWPGKIREPDIAFYLNEHRDRLDEQHGGPPDLVVEVLSPSTRQTDLKEKLSEYARAGVGEYWIVDPDARWVELYHPSDSPVSRYRRIARFTPGDTATSTLLPGFTLSVDTLFT